MPKLRGSRTTKPRKRVSDQQDTEWYSIKAILDEREIDGYTEYFVDWEDNPVTGQSYSPTWAWSRDVTDTAKAEWQRKTSNTEHHHHEIDPESQSPRPANFRHLQRTHLIRHTPPTNNIDTSLGSHEQTRIEHRVASSTQSILSPVSPLDFPETQGPRPDQQFVIDILKSPEFDQTEFNSVPSTQTPAFSSQLPLAELEEEDRRLAVSSSLSQGTIPDSQSQPLLAETQLSPFHQDLAIDFPNSPIIGDSYEHLIDHNPHQKQTDQQQTDQQQTESTKKHNPQISTTVKDHTQQLDSSAESPDLPSRQPQDQSFESPLHNPYTGLEEPAAGHGQPKSVQHSTVLTRSLTLEPPLRLEEASSGGFLTQPQFDTCFDNFSSYPSHQTHSSQDFSVVQASQAVNYPQETSESRVIAHSLPASPTSPTSQAAQIIPRSFHTSQERISDSNDTDLSAHAHAHAQIACSAFTQDLNCETDIQSVSHFASQLPQTTLSLASSYKDEQQQDPRTPPSLNSVDIDMAEDTPEAPSTGRRSAVDELHDLINLNSSIAAEPPTIENPLQEPEDMLDIPLATDSEEQVGHELEEAPVSDAVLSLPFSQLGEAVQSSEQSATAALHSMIDHVQFGQTVIHPPPPNFVVEEDQIIADPMELHQQQTTVFPGDIVVSPPSVNFPLLGNLVAPNLLPPASFDSVSDIISGGNQPLEDVSSSKPSSIPTSDVQLQTRYVVTLPFQANVRPQYDDALLDAREDISTFAGLFSSDTFVEPDQQLVKKIDAVFTRLYDFCDYPQDIVGTSLESLTPAQQVKYACDANSKFDFVYELLREINIETKVLIVARSVELLRVLHHVTQVLQIQCTAPALSREINNDYQHSPVAVTLALPNEEYDLSTFQVVVGFDHGFGSSAVGMSLSNSSPSIETPLVLLLVAMYSLEHIDAEIDENLNPLERKNAFLGCIVRARKFMADHYETCLEPRELAQKFCDYINGVAGAIAWKPTNLPDDVLDIFVSPQVEQQTVPEPEMENGRKRRLDDSDDEAPKRMRILPRGEVKDDEFDQPLPDDVLALLQSVTSEEAAANPTQARIKVQLSVLQALAEKVADQERRLASKDSTEEYTVAIDTLEKRIKSYERSSNKMYKLHRAAIQDRTQFEAEKRKAEEALEKSKSLAQKQEEKNLARITQLEEMVARLTPSEGPDGNQGALATSEKLLKEANEKAEALSRSLKAAQKEGEYARTLYQDASTVAASCRAENSALVAQNQDLQKKTSDTLVNIHKIQSQTMTDTYVRQIDNLKIQVREREVEVDRCRDELRQIKSARRDTRGGSVPRSPRMGMMSPRPGRAYAIAGSRGTSPAPVPGVDGAVAGNGRFNHLRE